LLAPALRHHGATQSRLGQVLQWLDAACFAATDTGQVRQACAAHPEWQLRCSPFDGSDRDLRALSGLLQACRQAGHHR
jgi:hypothetical protein